MNDVIRHQLPSGELVPVTATHRFDHATIWLLRREDDVLDDATSDEPTQRWVLTWTDGINDWVEEWDDAAVAYCRLAALVTAVESGTYLVHEDTVHEGVDAWRSRRAFVVEVERFLSRTVHASSCRVGCRGDDPVNHWA